MSVNKYWEAFGQPFEQESIKWRIQYMNREKTKGFAVPYADSRAIADRLDKTVGQFNWQDSYTAWHNSTDDKSNLRASQICTISIYFDEKDRWVSKSDGAENTDIEPVKGGLSDAFKRAASKWNIGRYLYKFNGVWVEIEERGKSYAIKDSEETKLNDHYQKTVARIFDTSAVVTKQPNKNTEPPKPQESSKPDSTNSEPLYTISGVQINNGASGTNSTIKLVNTEGKSFTAYLRGKNEKLANGVRLKNVKLLQKDGNYGKYNVLDKYEIAA